MKSALIFLVLAAITCLVLGDLNADWVGYKKEFSKIYDDSKEDGLRKEIYRLTVEEIKEHNADYAAKKVSYEKGINQFTDLTTYELKQRRIDSGLPKLDLIWPRFKTRFNKSYDTKEDPLRNTIFHKNMIKLEKQNNARKESEPERMNKFTDMTAEEIQLQG